MIKQIIAEYKSFLVTEPEVYFSPGRVNLIGEHIDYLGGNVFPAAIDLGTYALVTKREDNQFCFLSHNFPKQGKVCVDLNSLLFKKDHGWVNYAKGMMKSLLPQTVQHGLNILVYGTLPNSSGLSSSASLEVLIGTVLNDFYKLGISMFDLVQIAQRVENDYMGVNCGIMDQFSVGMSQKDNAIYLNTNTLEYDHVPLALNDYTLVIANTNKKRTLSDSMYNIRRSECDKGLEILQTEVEIDNLCDLDVRSFKDKKHLLQNPIIRNRVEHAVNENERTKNAVTFLKNGNIEAFGILMNESHNSLRDLFEVSCVELDTLVDAFRKYGAIGSRMTGAGFGGCTISLVPTDKLEDIINNVKETYYKKIGYHADFYPVRTAAGAHKIEREDYV